MRCDLHLKSYSVKSQSFIIHESYLSWITHSFTDFLIATAMMLNIGKYQIKSFSNSLNDTKYNYCVNFISQTIVIISRGLDGTLILTFYSQYPKVQSSCEQTFFQLHLSLTFWTIVWTQWTRYFCLMEIRLGYCHNLTKKISSITKHQVS